MATNAVSVRPRSEAMVSSAACMVEMRGITKAYGPTLANRAIDLLVPRGAVVGLVGGNGAGKSTLMRSLSGVEAPDAGSIAIDGRPVDLRIYDAGEAQRRGIRIVHQELSLCGNLTVAENFFLETPEAARPRPGWRRVYRARARAALDAVFPGNGIDVDRRIDDLPLGQRQMVEIARAAGAPGLMLLVLDEPTSSLDIERSRQLRTFIKERAAAGLAFIFISHKLNEIMDISTGIVVLRNGAVVWSGSTDISAAALVEAMGGPAENVLRSQHARVASRKTMVLRVSGDIVAPLGRNLEFFTGEIVGLAGLEGSGQKAFLHRIFAAARRKDAGVRLIGNASFVSGDRQREGIFAFWSVLANMDIARVAQRFALRPFRDASDEGATRDAAHRLRLDAERLASGILDLSGGNQQKALVGRALITDAATILLDDPTRGVDVGAKADFYTALARSAGVGRLMMWHSTEDAEFLECDRVLVFSRGRIIRELFRADLSEQAIVDASFAEMTTATNGMPSAAATTPTRRRWAETALATAPFISLVVVLAVLSFVNPTAASPFGLDLLLGPAVALVLVALAQMFAVSGSEIDLGIGAFAGFVNVLSATLLVERPLVGLAGIALAFMAYAGLGLLIQWRKIPAIVVTLGASFIWSGVGYTLQPTPGGSSPDWLTALFGWSIPGIPTMAVLILLAGLVAFALDRSPLGVVLRGFGNNAAALNRGGWSPTRYAIVRYLIVALFGTIAGLSLTAINTASDINAGGPFTLLSIASVVMGGCSLIGGRVASGGVVAGALTLSLIGAVLATVGVSTDYNAAVQGLLLLLVLILRSGLSTRTADQ
ncbi:ATP-binding cassette domain-containing protein [Lichenifustis flavocetrariae]|uniref:ATP-binding cassette domain-containing protein n=1 Tax=Lichenifustis flavocetrariae TaxID=2949735 RepID=A0AA41YVF6_9HYPH|nr:ATP-binding cassette domain-containing protein [Lichenifustis flavocetrariae]MCW6508844.1 ATP-binding cassette domain-containing protein [Lichenifustis flavocetrariae]